MNIHNEAEFIVMKEAINLKLKMQDYNLHRKKIKVYKL